MRAQNNNTKLPESIGAREVMGLAWPVIVQMLSFNAMLLADAIFVGRLGTGPLAAVGLAGTAFFLLRAFGNGLLGGVRVATSQAVGAEDHDTARRMGFQGLYLALAVGLPVALAGPLGPPLFALMGAEPGLGGLASEYFSVLVWGAPFGCMNMALSAWFQGRGDTKTPMWCSVTANLLNIGLNPLFIFGFGPVPAMGVAGAALATTASRVTNSVLMLYLAGRELKGANPKPDLALLREVWRLGSPIGTQWLLDVGSYAVFASMLAMVGEAHLAAHVVVVRIICISFLPGYAIGEAAGVLVGQAVGARRPQLARQAWFTATWLATVIMVGCGGLFVAVPDQLLSIFKVEPEVAAIGRQLLYVAAAFQVFDAVATVANGALTGAGDTRFVMFVSVVSAWFVKVPIGWVLAIHFGLGALGAWLGLFGEILFFAALVLWRVRGGAWLAEPQPPLPQALPAK